MYVRERESEAFFFLYIIHDRVNLLAFVNMVLNFRLLYRAHDFLTKLMASSFMRNEQSLNFLFLSITVLRRICLAVVLKVNNNHF
jgi:hypothetical protein